MVEDTWSLVKSSVRCFSPSITESVLLSPLSPQRVRARARLFYRLYVDVDNEYEEEKKEEEKKVLEKKIKEKPALFLDCYFNCG